MIPTEKSTNNQLEIAQYPASVNLLHHLPITFHQDTVALARSTVSIALQQNITYDDACFIALARSLKAPLITANPKHQPHLQVKIVSLGHYR